MAKTKNILLQGMSGAFGKEVVFKTRGKKTFASKFPDTSGVVATDWQRHNRNVFAEAVNFAAKVINDPVRVAAFRKNTDKNVYLAAMKEFMSVHTSNKKYNFKRQYWAKRLANISLTERQIQTALFIEQAGFITNADCQHIHAISKPTATRDLQALVSAKILEPSGGRGPAAVYKKGSWWDEDHD